MKIPQPKSFEQILGEMLAEYMSKTGVNDLNPGSLVTQFFETVALATAKSSAEAYQIFKNSTVDSASGNALFALAADEGLTPIPATPATGSVTIVDTSFDKVSTKIYAATPAPNIGSTVIFVNDASQFPASGSLYIGRGTSNEEGPLTYSSKTNLGLYWQINLSMPTARFHNNNESVVLAQGGVRIVPNNTVLRAAGTGGNPDVIFRTQQDAVLLDGENQVDNIPIIAEEPGIKGNVPAKSINEFLSPPFPGAKVFNPAPLNSGKDSETEEELRFRIKNARLSRGLGTATAVKNSSLGVRASDEPSTVVSAEIVSNEQETNLFIDDGTGYETKNAGVGYEILTDSALGGETHFQLKTGGKQSSVTKAELIANFKGPYDVRGGDRIAIKIGNTIKEHVFSDSDFISPGAATGYEIAASVNANPSLHFEATTRSNGQVVVFKSKSNTIDDIQAVEVSLGRNLRDIVGLPLNKIETVKLFKNKRPLSKDGVSAEVITKKQAQWAPTITSGDTLILNVDKTGWKTYTIVNADFIAEGTYTSVSATNSLESWVNVFNNKLTGATASIIGEQISIRSNLGESSRASIEIDPSSTLVVKGMFDINALNAEGRGADFKISRNTAQISLKTPLNLGDKLTAGVESTSAFVEFDAITGGTTTLLSPALFYIVVDDLYAKIINTGLAPNTFLTVSKPTANIVRYTSSVSNAFANLMPGDYVINVSQELNTNNRLEGRVLAVGPSQDYFELEVTASEFTNAVPESSVIYKSGIVFVRTNNVPYRVEIGAGTKDAYQIAQEIEIQVPSVRAFVEDEERIILESYTKETVGSLLIPYFNQAAENIGLNKVLQANAYESLTAFVTTGIKEGFFPRFIHSTFTGEQVANPTLSTINTVNSAPSVLSNVPPEGYVGMLHQYGQKDTQAIYKNNVIDNINYTTGAIAVKPNYQTKRIRLNDRFYLAYPLDLSSEDFFVSIYDSDFQNKTYKVNLFRNIKTNTTLALNSNSFNANDNDVVPAVPLTTYFNTFDFSNFRAYMRAKRVLNQSAAQDALLFRSKAWGLAGEKISVGYYYPTTENSPITHIVEFADSVKVKIFLKSGALVSTSIDGTTGWNISITPNNPVAGVDQVTFTWNGVGTAPALTGLSGGEYVTISSGGTIHPKNTGTFRVSDLVGFTPTANSFTVVRKNGEAVSENNVYTVIPSVFKFYQAQNTTALEIKNYVDANLTDLITATIVNDSGLTGSGVIARSTYEYTNFSDESLFLQDGLAYISTSNISGSPQFVLKKPLNYISDVGYAFNDGEEIRLVPTTIEQVYKFIKNPAVSGVFSVSDIDCTQDNTTLSLTTKKIGGAGSVFISGGSANKVSVPVVASTDRKDGYIMTRVSSFAAKQLAGGQLVKLTASIPQKKRTFFLDTNLITITTDTLNNESYLKVDTKQLKQNLFGGPRINTGLMNGTNFKIEKQGALVCLSHGDTSPSPNFSINNPYLGYSGDLEIVKNNDDTVLFTVNSASSLLFSHINIGDKVTVSGMAKPENNGTFYVEGVLPKQLLLFNPNAKTELSYASITITDNLDVSGDDFVFITSSTYSFTAGVDFPVGVNANETASNLAAIINTIPELNAVAVGNTVNIESNQSGFPSYSVSYVNNVGLPGATVVNFQHRTFSNTSFTHQLSVQEGDTMEVYAQNGVEPTNIGRFRVIRSYGNSVYFENENAKEQELTSTPIPISTNVHATSQFNVTKVNGVIIVQWTGVGTAPDLKNIMPGDYVTLGSGFATANQGTWYVMEGGKSNKIHLWNPFGVNETGISNVSISCQRPVIKFWPYDAVQQSDKLHVSSDILGVDNLAVWTVKRVISNKEIVIDGLMSPINLQPLGIQADNVFVMEKDPYVGYKEILYCHVDPDINEQAVITFNTYQQYDKINDSAQVFVNSVNKLNFPQNLIKGIFAYKYDTGLIGEVNRVVYGDPRSPVKYPGVAAAGSEIFIREPLIKRVQVTIDVRIQSGRPFNLIVEQVRSKVAALINSNPIGQSIAISKIISTVNSINGVKAVAISSPLYDNQNDLIKLQPFEKAKIIDPVADISVKKIGL